MDGRSSRVVSGTWLLGLVVLLALTGYAGPALGVEIIGGAVYTDLSNPLVSGLAEVTVTVTGAEGTFTPTTAGAQGLWQVDDVPEGTYTVTPSLAGWAFEHTVGGVSDGQASIEITVNAANRAANQSIQFVALPGETIGGAIYTDLANPLATGLEGVMVTVSGPHGPFEAATAGTQGLWQIDNVPVSDEPYTVTPVKADYRFEPNSIEITVNEDNRAANQSIQFQAIDDAPVPTQLAFVAQPEGPYAAGAEINAIPQVAVQDASGNTIASSTAGITIALGQNPGGGTLSGTTTRQAVNGVASFPGLSINKAGVGYTLVASTSGLTNATSNAFTVNAGPATKLRFDASPSSGSAGGVLSPAPQIGIYDNLDNLVTASDASVTVQLLGGPDGADMTGTTTVNAVNGMATFSDLVVNLAGSYQLEATAAGLTSAESQSFSLTAEPVLSIEKTGSADPVDPNSEVTYTITYGNAGLAAATGTEIVETLPEGMEYVSSDGGGDYDEATRTITWAIGSLEALSGDREVGFTARVGSNMPSGGVVTNSNLTIDCAETEPVQQVVPETTTVNDKEGPTVTPIVPVPGAVVAIDSIVSLRITDSGGVSYGDDTVTISIGASLIYDGANETDPNRYDSTGRDQPIRGICRRTGSSTAYTFTFQPSEPYGFDKELTVSVHATDEAGNTTDETYSFGTQPRVFGANSRVNSDTGTLVQDNPATAVDSEGNIWVVWDQTSGAGDTGIYISSLAAGASAFSASTPVAATATNERNPAIAVDANDVLYVVWERQDPNTGWDVLISSFDGAVWSSPVRVAQEDPNDPSDQMAACIAVDRSTQPNTIYVAWEDTRSENRDIWLASSVDSGATWKENQITTNSANQTQPMIGVDASQVLYVIWTDARNAAETGTDIYGTTSEEIEWENRALVTAAGDQSAPAGVALGDVHLLWVSDANDIMYANDTDDTLPFTGASIIDSGVSGTRGGPALAGTTAYGVDALFAAWHDGRYAALGDPGDIFFAESGSSFGTNILVNDDEGTALQMKPAISVDSEGNPYLVWVDDREGNNDIFYAGAVAIEPPFVRTVTWAEGITTVAAADQDVAIAVEVPDGALPEGIDVNDISFRQVTNLPDVPPGGFGLCYAFGPSGTEFSVPVTIRIPLADDSPVYSTYNVYRYDPGTLSWTTEGIHNPATKVTTGTGAYLRVQVDHFSTFGVGGFTTPAPNGGGGCALAPWSNESPMEFAVPFFLYVLVLLAMTVVDRARRRADSVRH